MTVLGAGTCPAGSSVGGFGVPTAAAASTGVPFPDPLTGLSQSGYQIGQPTGDYAFTSDGRVLGCPTVRALVEHAILTTFNSSAVPGFGLQLPFGDKTTGFSKLVASKLSAAIDPLVKQGLVQIVNVRVGGVQGAPNGTIGTLTWRDLTAPPPNALNGGPPSNQYTTSF